MKITIHRSGTNHGPYSLEQTNLLLASGQLRPSDLAWVEGTPEWSRLEDVPGVLVAPPPASSSVVIRSIRDDGVSDKLLLPAFLLAFWLGPFGIHRFYVGKTGSGIAMLVLTVTVIGAVVSGVWAVVDWIVMLFGGFTDAEGRRLARWT